MSGRRTAELRVNGVALYRNASRARAGSAESCDRAPHGRSRTALEPKAVIQHRSGEAAGEITTVGLDLPKRAVSLRGEDAMGE